MKKILSLLFLLCSINLISQNVDTIQNNDNTIYLRYTNGNKFTINKSSAKVSLISNVVSLYDEDYASQTLIPTQKVPVYTLDYTKITSYSFGSQKKLFDSISKWINTKPITDVQISDTLSVSVVDTVPVSIGDTVNADLTRHTRIYRYFNSVSGENATVINSSPTNLLFMSVGNATTAKYIKLYNKATSPTNADTPVITIYIGQLTNTTIPIGSYSMYFSNGLSMRMTGNVTDSDTTSVAANTTSITFIYK